MGCGRLCALTSGDFVASVPADILTASVCRTNPANGFLQQNHWQLRQNKILYP
jgi:hypothetical protein